MQYGVVPAVNKLLATGDWEAAYFAFEGLMYCDIAIRRKARKLEAALNRFTIYFNIWLLYLNLCEFIRVFVCSLYNDNWDYA